MKIGAQLYTVRDACQTLPDFANTLARVAEMGYTTVQVSGACPFEPEWLRDELKKNGLTCDLTHVEYEDLVKDTEKVVNDHKVFGCKYIGLGNMPGGFERSVAGARAFCEAATPTASRMKELGAYLMYHNHGSEYELNDGTVNVMTALSDSIPEDHMGFTLDTYWVQYGGYDPVEEIKRLKNRIPAVHFKDMEVLPDGTRRYTPVGNGILDFEKMIEALEGTSCEFAYVEQDLWFGRDPFECLKMSYDYLSSLGLK